MAGVVRRRPEPKPERVWRLADVPERLRVLVPEAWGCTTGPAQWKPSYQAACRAWREEHDRCLDEHNVDPVQELRERVAARHPRLVRNNNPRSV